MPKAKRQSGKQVRLKKDLIVPAGTLLSEAPEHISMASGHYEYVIGMGRDNTARLIVFLERDPETAEWLEKV